MEMNNKMVKFRGYKESDWLEHKANLKWFRTIIAFDLRQTPSYFVFYVFTVDNKFYPQNYIIASKN